MKIRTGFVSNSSSSSFIVAFDRMPVSVGDLRQMLFGDKEYYPNPYADIDTVKAWPTYDIAEIVFKDLTCDSNGMPGMGTIGKCKSVSKKRILDELLSGVFAGDIDIKEEADVYRDQIWRDYHMGIYDDKLPKEVADKYLYLMRKDSRERAKARKVAAKEIVEKFLESAGADAKIFVFEYSDNNGSMFSAMEHGTLFDRLPHLRVSKH